MQFSSFQAFIAMENHGFYVWLSYGISFVLLTLLVVLSFKKNKQVISQIRQRQQRELKLKKAAENHHKTIHPEDSLRETP